MSRIENDYQKPKDRFALADHEVRQSLKIVGVYDFYKEEGPWVKKRQRVIRRIIIGVGELARDPETGWNEYIGRECKGMETHTAYTPGDTGTRVLEVMVFKNSNHAQEVADRFEESLLRKLAPVDR